jgi:hypothetical protein
MSGQRKQAVPLTQAVSLTQALPLTQAEILQKMHRLEITHQQLQAQLSALPPRRQSQLPAHISNEIAWPVMTEYDGQSVTYFTRGHPPGR